MATEIDVLVVGAGPVGLLAAAELRRHGVACRIVDKLPTPAGWVKALSISPRTLELFDDLGLAADALDAGLLLERQRTFVNGEPASTVEAVYPGDAPYRHPLLLPQPETERILRDHLARLGGDVERGVALESFVEHGDRIEAVLASDRGKETVVCRYLVGCDGAHSAVRRGLGVSFEGGRFPSEFLLADVAIDWEIPHGEAVLFTTTCDGTLDNLLVCIPYRDANDPGRPRYRLSTMAKAVSETDWENPPDERIASTTPAPTLADVRGWVSRFSPMPAAVDDLRWASTFRIAHRIAGSYRVGRAFLAGDAAHIHPPTGGQGMNTGLQDAYNLAWKLALAVRGRAADGLLDSYDRERRPVGQAVVERTKQRSTKLADRTQGNQEDARRADSQLELNYRGSGWVIDARTSSAGPQAGDRAPDVAGLLRPGVDAPLRLFDLLRGPHHTLFAIGNEPLADAAKLVRSHGNDVKAYRILPAGTTAIDREFPVISDTAGQFAKCYSAESGQGIVVRPDGTIGLRTDQLTLESLGAYLDRIFARNEH